MTTFNSSNNNISCPTPIKPLSNNDISQGLYNFISQKNPNSLSETVDYLYRIHISVQTCRIIYQSLRNNKENIRDNELKIYRCGLNKIGINNIPEDSNKEKQLAIMVELAKNHLTQRLHNINEEDECGINQLLEACQDKCLGKIDFLLQLGAHLPKSTLGKSKTKEVLEKLDENGSTLLHRAIEKKYVEVSKFLINEMENINIVGFGGNTPLHHAIVSSHDSVIIESLVAHKNIDINIQNSNGLTPLILALISRNETAAKILIERGADANILFNQENALYFACLNKNIDLVNLLVNKTNLERTYQNGDTFLLHVLSLPEPKFEIVEAIINAGANLSAINLEGETPWSKVVDNDKFNSESTYKIIDLLLSKGIDINTRASNGTTLLMKIASNGSVEKLKEYKDKGADLYAQDTSGNSFLAYLITGKYENSTLSVIKDFNIDIKQIQPNIKGDTFLHKAAKFGTEDLVKYIIENSDSLNTQNEHGVTPLMAAIYSNKIRNTKLLIDNKADVNKTDIDKFTPLHVASHMGYTEIVNILLEIDNIKLEEKNCNGDTPLICASFSKMSKIETIKMLLLKGANHLAANDLGHTTWNLLIEKENFKNSATYGVVDILLSKGIDINTRCRNGKTLLMKVAKTGTIEKVREYISKGGDPFEQDDEGTSSISILTNRNSHEILSIIKDLDITKAKPDKFKNTILHIAVKKGNLDLVQYLLEKGNFLNERNKFGYTPLITAISNDQEECAKLIIRNNADVNIPSNRGITPLHLACEYNMLVDEILKAGGDSNASDNMGKTPLLISVNRKDENSVRLLIEHNALVTHIPNEDGNSILSSLLRNLDSALFYELAERFLKESENINLHRGDYLGYTPIHSICVHGAFSLLDIIKEKILPRDFIEKNNYYQNPFELALGKNLWNNSSKMESFLGYVLQGCLQNDIFEEIKKNELFSLTEYLNENTQKLLLEAKSNGINPIEVPLLLNDIRLAISMKNLISDSEFKKYQEDILEKYGPQAGEFCGLLNFYYEVNPTHLIKGVYAIPENNAEETKIDELLELFDAQENLALITPSIFSNKPREFLRNILQEFIDKVNTRFVYTATPQEDQPEQLEKFYKTIEVAQTHIIKRLKSLEGEEKQKKISDVC